MIVVAVAPEHTRSHISKNPGFFADFAVIMSHALLKLCSQNFSLPQFILRSYYNESTAGAGASVEALKLYDMKLLILQLT